MAAFRRSTAARRATARQTATRIRPVKARKNRAYFDWRYVPGEKRRAYRMACILFWSILMYFVIQRYVVSFDLVMERSMHPTLTEGQAFLVNRYIYHFGHPRRGDIVALRRDRFDSEQYVKRVIALEGELLMIRNGTVYVNGHPLSEPYAVGGTFPDYGPYRIAQGFYFVMGDHRIVSEDSRSFGPISRRDIRGRITPHRLFSFF